MAGTQAEATLGKVERLRNLEILKYGASVRIDHEDDASNPFNLSLPRAADDALLTALCQLAAVRLQCQRAFFCLSDSQRQHIVAEATRTLSPYDQSKHAPDDELMFGVTSFDADFGITHVTMPAYTRGSQHFLASSITSINDQRSIFLDLRNESLLQDVPFLQGKSPPRFYLEVPVKNTAGIVIGILAVLDSEPRSSFDDIDARPMFDVARLIMEHLELVRVKDINAHAERLLQGLAQFNVGQSSIHPQLGTHPAQTENLDIASTDSEVIEHMLGPRMTYTEQDSSSIMPSATTSANHQENSTKGSKVPFDVPSTATSQTRAADVTTVAAEQGLQGRAASQVQQLFPRAANLIREAMNLDTTCFVEMPADSRFSVDRRKENGQKEQQPQDAPTVTRSRDFVQSTGVLKNDLGTRNSSPEGQRASTEEDGSDAVLCEYTAFSTKETNGLTSATASKAQLRLPARALGILTSAYPTGHIFHFDAHGLISSGDDHMSGDKVVGRHSRRSRAINALSKTCPRARSLLFVPFYDGERQKMHSAFFGWIENSPRVLVDSELVYVAGFAHSVMCEVIRLETLMVEKAKSMFMSSISHELRSPLHGILASTELLRESRLTSEQNELALMMDTCGRTLLDITNNLLEHAKINNMVDHNDRRKRRKGKHSVRALSSSRPIAEPPTSTTVASLVDIVEETVASVVSGHAVKIQRAEHGSSGKCAASSTVKCAKNLDIDGPRAPTVILDIEKTGRCFFHVDPGAWRRIVMNLVGNALNYTSTGYIVIELKVAESRSKFGRQPDRVVLTVKDTGQGISKAFMKRSLFSPFTQEDQLSVGVGLGLSIVHRLVSELDGQIKIDSEINVGTNVQVAIPLPVVARLKDIPAGLDSAQIRLARDALKSSDSVCLCGFDSLPKLGDEPDSNVSLTALGLLKLKESLTTISGDWFGLQSTTNVDAATIYIVEARHARFLLEQDPFHIMFSRRYVVVSAYNEAKIAHVSWPGSHHVVAVPVGPLKLARSLIVVTQEHDKPTREVLARHQPLPSRTLTPNNEFHLPFSTTSPSRSPTASPRMFQSDKQMPRMLLVDDNDINTKVLAGLVRKLGNPFATARNGKEALDEFIAASERNEPFQFVFMDISMPVMDGLTSARRIREYESDKQQFPRAQIFALSGLGNLDTQDAAMASGVDQYFRKPVRLDTLRRAISLPRLDEDRT